MKSLTIQELEQIGESKHLSTLTNRAIEYLLNAISDWPNQVRTLDEYECEVRLFVGGEVTKLRVNQALSQIDYSKNAWEAESLSQLLSVFELFPHEDLLKHILERIESEY